MMVLSWGVSRSWAVSCLVYWIFKLFSWSSLLRSLNERVVRFMSTEYRRFVH